MFRQYQLTKENKRLVLRFAVSLLVTVLLTVMLCTLSAFAEQGSAEQVVSTAEALETEKQPGTVFCLRQQLRWKKPAARTSSCWIRPAPLQKAARG